MTYLSKQVTSMVPKSLSALLRALERVNFTKSHHPSTPSLTPSRRFLAHLKLLRLSGSLLPMLQSPCWERSPKLET